MDNTTAHIPDRWITPVWVGVVAIVAFQMIIMFIAIPYRIAELTTICVTEVCTPLYLTEADVTVLNELGLSPRFYGIWITWQEATARLFVLIIIGLLVWKARTSWVAVLAVFSFFLLPINISLPWMATSGSWLVIPFRVINGATGMLFFLLIAVFPDGTFNPPWVRKILAVTIPILIILTPLVGDGIYQPFPFSDDLHIVYFPLIFANFALVLWVQAYRYRNIYTYQQKQQTRWLIVGVVVMAFAVITWLIFFETNLRDDNLIPHGRPFLIMTMLASFITGILPGFGIPGAITIAILRYRLWNVDIIIRRTLQYGAITAILAAVYFGTVVLLQSVFRGIAGTESPIMVVLSTLLIAALFNPVRQRVQRVIDRRFYRQRYDAEQILADFSDAMRDEVDIEQIERELLNTVSTTLEPEHVSLWILKEQK